MAPTPTVPMNRPRPPARAADPASRTPPRLAERRTRRTPCRSTSTETRSSTCRTRSRQITTPRHAAAWRKTVMNSSRPRTTTRIQSGSPTAPNGVTNGAGSRQAGGSTVNAANAAAAIRARTLEHVDRGAASRHEQQFVGQRIEQAAKVRDQIAVAGELPVDVVGDGGDDEQRERRETQRPRRRERRATRDARARRRDAPGRDRSSGRFTARTSPCAKSSGTAHGSARPPGYRCYASDLSTSLLTALSVSNTPSPVTATASKYGARSTHSPVGICSTGFRPDGRVGHHAAWRAASSTSQPGLSAACRSRDRRGVRQIPLVVLDDERHAAEVVAVLGHVVVQVLHRFLIRFHALDLRVGDEHDAVDALEDQLAAGVVVDLARHRVEMEARLESADRPEIDRQEIEEQRAFGFRRQRDQLPARVGLHLAVDVLEIGGLAAEPGP